MKSLYVKKVVLKNPRLRAIRCNLRIILMLAVDSELERLDKLDDLYTEKRRSRGILTPSQKKRESALIRISNELRTRLYGSTCKCASPECVSHQKLLKQGLIKPWERSLDLDLVWIPWYEIWVCVKCYEKYYKHMTLEQFIRSKSHPDLGLNDGDLMYLIQKYRDSFKYKD